MSNVGQNNSETKTEQTPNIEGNGGSEEADATGSMVSSHLRVFAKNLTEKSAAYYNMKHKHRGIALIFNHEHFEIPFLDPRTGTNVDSDNLTKVLQTLGFAVTVLNDLTLESVNKQLQQTADMDHSDNDCLAIAVLTHGDEGILYAKDSQYNSDTLWNYFTADKCLTLAGKPKLFFIQACQGDQLDGGVVLTRSLIDASKPKTNSSFKIPIRADFLIVHSTAPGYFSWRNTKNGSWFIQALFVELRDLGQDCDILTLLTFVSQRVAIDFESNNPNDPSAHRQKQVPCITSMLTRVLIFGKK